MFLKIYATEHVNLMITGADEKAFRKWVWLILEPLSCLNLVSFLIIQEFLY